MDKTDLKNEILRLFQLSISAHNSQPFKLKTLPDSFEIVVDSKRHLPIADPHQRDLRIALGALKETLKIGLSAKGCAVSFDHHTFKVAQVSGMASDSLASELPRRFSFRGKFSKIVPLLEVADCGEDVSLKFVTKKETKKEIAKMFDEVNMKFLTSPGYIEELYTWLRFTKDHPRWAKDGLNAESMGLDKVTAMGASQVMKPGMFRSLQKMRLLPAIITEAPVVESSSAIVAIIGKKGDEDSIGAGFMRGWLKLTSMNLFGSPLSLLTDDPAALKKMREVFGLKKDEIVYNFMRVGPLAEGYQVPERSRLSKEDLNV